MTNPIDAALYRSLARLHRAYAGFLATRAINEVTPEELALEAQWQAELEPCLRDLYWYPLRNGLEGLPTDATALEDRLRHDYDRDVAIAALLALLLRYQVRGVNVGGSMGLNLLGVPGHFTLTNQGYLATLHGHAQMLTSVDGDMSLINTTIGHLTQAIPAARAGDNPLITLGNLIAGWSLYRSTQIAHTERSRTFVWGLNWTYRENGVRMQVFNTREHGCPACEAVEGEAMPVDNIPPHLEIPKHPGCDCVYSPLMEDWDRPVMIWRGGP